MSNIQLDTLYKIIDNNNQKYKSYETVIKSIDQIELSINNKIRNESDKVKNLQKLLKNSLDYYHIISKNLCDPKKNKNNLLNIQNDQQ